MWSSTGSTVLFSAKTGTHSARVISIPGPAAIRVLICRTTSWPMVPENNLEGYPFMYVDKYLWWNYYNNNTSLDRDRYRITGTFLQRNQLAEPYHKASHDYTIEQKVATSKPTDVIGLMGGSSQVIFPEITAITLSLSLPLKRPTFSIRSWISVSLLVRTAGITSTIASTAIQEHGIIRICIPSLIILNR